MVNIMQLDLDVIYAIMSHINPKDAFPLALTCTSMHEPAMRRRLSQINKYPQLHGRGSRIILQLYGSRCTSPAVLGQVHHRIVAPRICGPSRRPAGGLRYDGAAVTHHLPNNPAL